MDSRYTDLVTRFENLASDPGDGRTTRLRKSLLLGGVIVLIPLVLPWSLLYFYLGYPMAALMPGFFFLFSSFSVVYFLRTRRREPLRIALYVLLLILPFALTVILGGFHNSSVVIIWCVIAPIAGLVIDGWENSRHWFALYLILLIVAGGLEPIFPAAEPLPNAMIRFFYVLNIGTVTTAVFALLFLFIREGWQAYILLQEEQEKSEELLLNVLPKEVAVLLKDEPRTVAEYYEAASVLFCDVVGFTPLTAGSTPQAMLEMLNEIFSHFDGLAERNGIEKISTIGDSYMLAAGVPVRRDDHAQAMARLALEMNAYIKEYPGRSGHPVAFRLGMSSGPLVAGVIGCSKYHYDIWGDTVNTASRMESHGVPGKIQIAQSTYKLLEDEFDCTPRGIVEIKGKGPMKTWFLEGAKSEKSGQ